MNQTDDEAGAYGESVTSALAHQWPCVFVENEKVTFPLDDVVPLPVETGVPGHEPDERDDSAYTERATAAPLIPVVPSVTDTARGTL